jgi:hypothetical protein
VANYNVDIAVAVKNTQAITDLSNKTDLLGQKIKNVNETLELFGNLNGKTVVNSVANFNKELAKAAKNFNDVQLGSGRAIESAREFAKAVDLENAALREQAALLAEVRNQGKSGTLRGGTQYKNPLGPFEASSIAPGAFKAGRGSSAAASEVTGLLERNLDIEKDRLLLRKKLREQEERSAKQLNEKLNLQNKFNGAMREGAAQAKALATQSAAAMGLNQPSGPLGPVADLKTQQAAAIAAAKKVEDVVINTAKKRQSLLDETNQKATQLARQFDRTELDLSLKRAKAKGELNKQIFDDLIRLDKDYGRGFDQRLKRRTEARKKAERDVAAARKKGSQGFRSAALGVGFPLLFGGGAGSITGGLLGSVGGFGGQILGSAIGRQVDQAVGAIARLGQALNPLTADLDAVVNAAGKSGTEFEKLIKKLEEVAGAEAALKEASEQLATQIGQGGVDALKQFGEESAELGNTFAVTLSQISAAVAELINKTGFLRGFIDNLARDNDLRAGIANTSDPRLQELKAARQSFIKKSGGVFYEEDMKPFEDRIILRQRELAVEKELTAQSRIRAGIQQAQAAKDADTVAILQAQVALKEAGLDLTTQEGYNLAETVVLREFDKKEQELIAKGVSKEVRDLERKLALLGLSLEARKQENRQAEEFERKFQQSLKKRRQLQANLLAEGNKQQEIENKITEATEGRAAAIQKELDDMQAAYTADAQRIILTTESRDLAQEKVDTLAKEYELRQLLLRQEYTELQLKKDLLAIEQKQTLSGIGTDLTRQIEDANLRPTGNEMQDQQLELRISQIRRQEDARRSLTNQIEKERAAILRYSEVGNASGVMDAQERVEGLQEQIALYDRLLPQLDAAEQAQLKFNQALEAAKPFADAFTSGLLDGMVAVVDGTKTAEQAFADFLNSIAKMLMQTAQQMIAQYIALGIARMFAIPGSYKMSGGGFAFGGSGAAPAGLNTSFIGSSLFGQRAIGGPVSGNRPYLVGERGPELFVPGAQGNIVPNSAMGSANVTVNVDASGSSVEGDSAQAGQLGKMLGAAVQAELIKQKRPGGLLAG